MATNSSSQTKNGSEGQTGCEACIKKDEIISELYEALKRAQSIIQGYSQSSDTKATKMLQDIEQALAKVK